MLTVGNIARNAEAFSTPPLMSPSSSSFFMFFLHMYVEQEGRGSCGSCGKPGVFGGFSKRVLESRSLRSDFKGAVGYLWEDASLRASFPQVFHSAVARGSFHRTCGVDGGTEGGGERGCW